jgi:hypothetical protein
MMQGFPVMCEIVMRLGSVMDDHDELAAALARYARATPFGDKHRPDGGGPVDTFPPLAPSARTRHPSQWVRMMRAVARLEEFPADNAEILAFEASTYLLQRAGEDV